jgi:hypothetical protein
MCYITYGGTSAEKLENLCVRRFTSRRLKFEHQFRSIYSATEHGLESAVNCSQFKMTKQLG